MKPVHENMIIDVVDESDTPIGKIRRASVLDAQLNFRVVHVLVFSHEGQLLLQRIPHHRTRHPGYWGSSVAGYIFAGEAYREAAARRLFQELGVRVSQRALSFIGKTWMIDQGCKKFIAVFRVLHDGPFRPQPHHIAKLEFTPIRDLSRSLRRRTREFTPTFLKIASTYLEKV